MAAILAADVVGYSRLMGEDEEGTLATLKAHRRELIDPKIATYRGRIVKTTGDGLLVEFPSAVDAVRCALDVQREMRTRNADVPAMLRFDFRVGINVGDIIGDGDDIFGDGVNIAARLEAVAEPGGICVSRSVRDQVRDRLAAVFADLGEQTVKNIARPVRMFRIAVDEGTPTLPGDRASAPPLPDKPSVAVLPFTSMSGDPDQEFFADGIVEDTITALSKFRSFFVIARNTAFTYKGRSVNVKSASQELGVQYLVEGSVRKSGDRVRVTAQLIDAVNDRHVWAERYDRELTDIFTIQDEMTRHIVMAVAPEIQAAEIERAQRKMVRELGTWELVVRAISHNTRFSPDDSQEAERLLARAIEQDPRAPRAYSVLAYAYAIDGLYGWHRPPPESLAKSTEMATHAVALDKNDDEGHAVLGIAYCILKRHGDAIRMFKTAIDLNPNSALAIGMLGIALVFTGERDEGAELLHRAIRLSPRDPYRCFYIVHLAMIEFFSHRYAQAIKWAERTVDENPRFPTGYRTLVACHGMLGNIEAAAANYRKLTELVPGMTIAATLRGIPFANPADAEHFADGLRRAGMPE